MAEALVLGIDIGGTNIAGGLANADGAVLVSGSLATKADGGPDLVVERVRLLIGDLLSKAGVELAAVAAVGVGCPGPLSHRDGVVYQTANMPGWDNYPLRERIAAVTGLPTTIDNDANLAALGEFAYGAGRGTRDMALLTLGTGVGGGLVLDGELVRGHWENAGELGHMIVVPGGEPCPCGQRGCLERYASAGAVARRYLERVAREPCDSALAAAARRGEPIDAAAVQAGCATDAVARQVWDEACFYLAVACVNLQHAVNPQRVVLAGGMAAAGDDLLGPTRRACERLTWSFRRDVPQIVLARCGADAGILGAAELACREFVRPRAAGGPTGPGGA